MDTKELKTAPTIPAEYSCEVWGHVPEPVIGDTGEALELRCARCGRPMHE